MPAARSSLLRSFGPAFVTASVVIGPGSIVTASKVGASFGPWAAAVLLVTTALMIGMTGLSARLGIALERTLCEEVAHRLGRPVAILIGASVFLVVACFQFGNNVGIATSIESLLTAPGKSPSAAASNAATATVVALNLTLIFFLFGFKQVYRWLERGMMLLVAIMLLAFTTNLLFMAVAKGTSPPSAADSAPIVAKAVNAEQPVELWRYVVPGRGPDGSTVDPMGPIVALLGTTFSVAGAFFQAYLVRQKGWGPQNLRDGTLDTFAGIGVLNLITLIILLTSALALRGVTIRDAGSIAAQLAPLYGSAAQVLFCLGLLAASLSSLLVNAAIGGSLLADGLGLGGELHQRWPKLLTLLAMAIGLAVVLAMRRDGGFDAVRLIVIAQATTVAAWPLLAGVLVWLAYRAGLTGELRLPRWMWGLVGVGLLLAVCLAPRTAYGIYLRLVPHAVESSQRP